MQRCSEGQLPASGTSGDRTFFLLDSRFRQREAVLDLPRLALATVG